MLTEFYVYMAFALIVARQLLLQFRNCLKSWEEVASEWSHTVFTTSSAQRSILVGVAKSERQDTLYRCYECNWEKVTRFTGSLHLKDSGPRYTHNNEAVTVLMCGPKTDNAASAPLESLMFPFWDASTGLPQHVQDELRVMSFRVAYENHGFCVATDKGKVRANRFEKGIPFGEMMVGIVEAARNVLYVIGLLNACFYACVRRQLSTLFSIS